MDDAQNSSFFDFLKNLLAPLAALVYFLAFIVEFKEKIKELGFTILCFSIFAFALIWAIYIWKISKAKNYNRLKRYGALFVVIISLIPVFYSLWPTKPITMKFSITNNTKDTISLKSFHQYNVHRLAANGFAFITESGIVNLGDKESSIIKPKETREITCVFANQNQIRSLISNGNNFLSLNINYHDSIDKDIQSNNYFYLNSENLKKVILELKLPN